MKKILSSAFVGAALLALAACGDDTETRLADAPVVTLSPSSVTLSSEAVSSYPLSYSVSSPQDGASVSASADASWVSVIDTSVSGQIRLSVAENASGELRSATLTLTYSYDDGHASAKAAIVQYGAGDTALAVDPNAVVADAAGGAYSFGYEINNPVDGEGVSCSASADWISGFDYSSYGTVSFTVAANDGEGLRTGTISVSYAGLSKEVTVVQDHPGSSDSGGGDGSIVGTYTVSGYAYGVGNTTWTMTIHQDASDPDRYWIDGLTPSDEGNYSYGTSYCAYGHYGSGTTFVIPSQVSDWVASDGGHYAGWTPCTEYSGGEWYYSSQFPDLTFTSKGNDTWVSDYGVFLGAFTSKTLSADSFAGFFDVVAPSLTITKVDGNVDLSEFVGTYHCAGIAYNENYDGTNEPGAEAEWTMKIYDHGNGQLLLSGLVPDTVDYYPYSDEADNGPYTAYATVSGNNIRVSYPQWTGWHGEIEGSIYYICWLCCPQYSSGFYYNTNSGTCTFTYDSASDSWTSDVGLFLGLCSSNSTLTQETFYSYYDVFAPGMTFTKTSSSTSTSATPSSLKPLDERTYHTGAKAAPASASSTNSVTRSIGPLRTSAIRVAM